MLNHATVMGRLTRDPELKTTPSGVPVVSFSVASEEDYKAKDGTRETDFIRVVAWRHTAEFVKKYFTKGSMVIVDGRIKPRTYTDKDGNKREMVEIRADQVYFGETKRRDDNVVAYPEAQQAGGYDGAGEMEDEDDLPF